MGKDEELGIDKKNIIMFSYSSGASLAPGLILHAKKQNIIFKKTVMAAPYPDFTETSDNQK